MRQPSSPSSSAVPPTPPVLGNHQDSSISFPSSAISSASDSEIVKKACTLDTHPKFLYIWDHAKSLINFHGQHDTLTSTTGPAGAMQTPSCKTVSSEEELASWLSAAQRAVHTHQPPGSAHGNLQVLRLLWEATVNALESLLEDGGLDLEVCAWGLIGLAAGYEAPTTTSAAQKKELLSYKNRLKAALISLPSLNSPLSTSSSGVPPQQRLIMLTKARREIHICSNMLIQQFRREGWAGIQWYHGITVAERWLENIGMGKMDADRRQ